MSERCTRTCNFNGALQRGLHDNTRFTVSATVPMSVFPLNNPLIRQLPPEAILDYPEQSRKGVVLYDAHACYFYSTVVRSCCHLVCSQFCNFAILAISYRFFVDRESLVLEHSQHNIASQGVKIVRVEVVAACMVNLVIEDMRKQIIV